VRYAAVVMGILVAGVALYWTFDYFRRRIRG
jgi:hypothetical protein